MKNCLSICLFFLISNSCFSQEILEDVIYLKNYTFCRGRILNELPAEKVEIQTRNYGICNFKMDSILKITKEPIELVANKIKSSEDYRYEKFLKKKLLIPAIKTYFGNVETSFALLAISLKTVHGYKFGRMAYLGLGTGIEYFNQQPFVSVSASQIPLFIRYEGDFSNRKTTGYLEAELGYAFTFSGDNTALFNHPTSYGNLVKKYVLANYTTNGMISAIGIGGKFFATKRMNVKLAAIFSGKLVGVKYTNAYYSDDHWNRSPYLNEAGTLYKFTPWVLLKIGVGF